MKDAGPREMQFSAVYVLGDSLSDNGNRVALSKFTRAYYELRRLLFRVFRCQIAQAFVGGRHCDGKVAVEWLSERLGFDLEPGWHVPGGTNYAVTGATVCGGEWPPGLRKQTQKLLSSLGDGERLPADALYIVYIGGNDVLGAAEESIPAANLCVDAAIDGIEECIRTLAAAGAVHFLVPYQGDVGRTPKFIQSWRSTRAGRNATRLSLRFNARLAPVLDALERKCGLDVVTLDAFAFGKSLFANPHLHGWTNARDSCLSRCSECDFERFMFFDRLHPTASRHRVNADAFYKALSERFAEGAADTRHA